MLGMSSAAAAHRASSSPGARIISTRRTTGLCRTNAQRGFGPPGVSTHVTSSCTSAARSPLANSGLSVTDALAPSYTASAGSGGSWSAVGTLFSRRSAIAPGASADGDGRATGEPVSSGTASPASPSSSRARFIALDPTAQGLCGTTEARRAPTPLFRAFAELLFLQFATLTRSSARTSIVFISPVDAGFFKASTGQKKWVKKRQKSRDAKKPPRADACKLSGPPARRRAHTEPRDAFARPTAVP